MLHYRPEVIGLGYLMPTEVAFTVWLSYALFKVEALIGRMLGWQFAGFPFSQEQGLGAYLTVAALLIYAARHYLRDWAKRLWNDDANADDALRPKEAALCLFVGVIGCLVFMVMGGMDWRIAAIYFALTLLVALVYARIRAEVGAPMVWLFPYYQHKKAILYTLGVNRVMGLGGLRNMTAFTITISPISREVTWRVPRLCSAHSISSAARRICSGVTGRFSHAFIMPNSIFWRLNNSRRPSFLMTQIG